MAWILQPKSSSRRQRAPSAQGISVLYQHAFQDFSGQQSTAGEREAYHMADVPGRAFSNRARMNAQMNLEAVQHLSGVPRYGISLLVMSQMWLMFVLRVCTVPRNHRTVTRHTLHRRLPNNNFGSLRKRSEPFSLCRSGGWKNQGQNKGKKNKRSKNKIQ